MRELLHFYIAKDAPWIQPDKLLESDMVILSTLFR